MTKNKKSNFDKTKGILIVVIGILIVVLIALISAYPKNDIAMQNQVENTPTGSIVSLGMLQYDFTGNKAVKRTDAHLVSLESFLKAEGEKSVNLNCDTVYHNVVAASPDEKQVLLSYGCGYPAIGMFAVYADDEWKTISPTNQFNEFGIPRCEHVEENNIERNIAPVCDDRSLDGSEQKGYVVR